MIDKIIWSILIILVLFLLAVFKMPDFSDSVSSLLGVPELSGNIRNAKEKFDKIVTTVPSKEEVKDSYNRVYSWAVRARGNIEEWIDVTKERIDSFRKTMSWAEEKYDKTKKFVEDTSEKISELKDVVDKMAENWDSVWWNTSTWSVE